MPWFLASDLIHKRHKLVPIRTPPALTRLAPFWTTFIGFDSLSRASLIVFDLDRVKDVRHDKAKQSLLPCKKRGKEDLLCKCDLSLFTGCLKHWTLPKSWNHS